MMQQRDSEDECGGELPKFGVPRAKGDAQNNDSTLLRSNNETAAYWTTRSSDGELPKFGVPRAKRDTQNNLLLGLLG